MGTYFVATSGKHAIIIESSSPQSSKNDTKSGPDLYESSRPESSRLRGHNMDVGRLWAVGDVRTCQHMGIGTLKEHRTRRECLRGVLFAAIPPTLGTGVQTESPTPVRTPHRRQHHHVPPMPGSVGSPSPTKIPVMISEIIYMPEMANHSNMSGSRLVFKVRHLLSLHLHLDT